MVGDRFYAGSMRPLYSATLDELLRQHQQMLASASLRNVHLPAPLEPGVYVFTEEGARELPHHGRHCPSGFSWGFAGSGPADLAHSILLDYLGLTPAAEALRDDDEGATVLPYHAFKLEVIAGLPPRAAWQISGRQIDHFLVEHRLARYAGAR